MNKYRLVSEYDGSPVYQCLACKEYLYSEPHTFCTCCGERVTRHVCKESRTPWGLWGFTAEDLRNDRILLIPTYELWSQANWPGEAPGEWQKEGKIEGREDALFELRRRSRESLSCEKLWFVWELRLGGRTFRTKEAERKKPVNIEQEKLP